jgi:hypothetical protein
MHTSLGFRAAASQEFQSWLALLAALAIATQMHWPRVLTRALLPKER